jgi:hypothetical protein
MDEMPNRKRCDHFGHWSNNAKSENDDEQQGVELIVKTCPNLSKALSSPGDDLKTSIPNWRNILRQKPSRKIAKNKLAAEIFEEGKASLGRKRFGSKASRAS